MTDPIRTPAEALEAAAQESRKFLGPGPCSDRVMADIRALAPRIPPAPNDEALVEIVAQALWEHGAMSFSPWCEANALERQGYVAEARAVLTALREVGALR